jgi:multiple sugar transport system substrate-binding protein
MTHRSRAGEAGAPRRRRVRAALVAVAALAFGTTAACGSSTSHSASGGSSSGTLTVWVDATRLPAAKLYQKQNPTVKMNIVTYDGDANGSNYLQTKVSLFNRTSSGWPDVVFSTQNNEASWAVPAGFLAPLDKGAIPQATLDGWAKGANAPCTVNGTVYCLRNDLSQTVLWYNAALMKQWGYTVPATWEDYQALGQKVATEHPGYLMGSIGDSFAPEIYLWASKCGADQITGPKAVTVNTSGPGCTKMAGLLDTLVKNKTMSLSSVFSTDFAKNYATKVLMMPGPAWFGGAVFQSGLKTPAGQLAVAPMPQWAGESQPTVGNVGGGTWLMSAHSKVTKEATDFLTWVTTSDDYQGKLAPGFPAYAPAAKTWLAAQTSSGYYASDPAPVLTAAADQVWSGWGYGQFSQESIWAATITPGLNKGQTITSLLPAWQTAIANYAKTDGYQVSQ